jgi:hypothetical protein
VLLVALLTITPWPVGAFQDDALYTVLAKSLATGKGYRLLNLPGAPNATHYPPGYPAVLALLWRLWPSFPDNIVLFKFANALFLALAALGTYLFASRRLGWEPLRAALVGIVGTLSIVVLLVTGVVLSEPLFMALLLPVLMAAEGAAERPGMARAFGAGLAIGVLALVRTIGVAALPGAILVLLIRRRWRDSAALLAGALLLLLPWQLWTGAHQAEVAPVLMGKYGAYGVWLAEGYRSGGMAFLREVVVSNLQSLDGMLSYGFMPVTAVWPRAVAFVALIALGAGGTTILVRRAPVSAAFVVGYLGITLVWPFEPNRFILAIWPLEMLVLGVALSALWHARPVTPVGRVLRLAALAVAAAMTIGFASYNATGFRRQWWASVQRDAGNRAKPVVAWIARHTREDDVVATDDDLMVYLYAGRRAVPTSTFIPSERVRPLSAAEDVAAVRALFAAYHPRFFITGSKQGIESATTLSNVSPPELRLVANTAKALIYERVVP